MFQIFLIILISLYTVDQSIDFFFCLTMTTFVFRPEWDPSASFSLSWGRCSVMSVPVTNLSWQGEFQYRLTTRSQCV